MSYLKVFLKRIIYLLGFYSVSRFFLFLNNLDSFSTISLVEFLEGLRFDISALLYINLPLLILLLFPTNLRIRKSYRKFTNIIFYVVNIPFLIGFHLSHYPFVFQLHRIISFQLEEGFHL